MVFRAANIPFNLPVLVKHSPFYILPGLCANYNITPRGKDTGGGAGGNRYTGLSRAF